MPRPLPITLPTIELDTTTAEYAAGYYYCATLTQAARMSGLWPNGRPARCLSVMASEDAIERGASRRASVLTIIALCSDEEIRTAMRELVCWADEPLSLVEEQWAWYVALGRPCQDEARVVEGLQAALAYRRLDWTLKQFETANDLWAARCRRAACNAWAVNVGLEAHSAWRTELWDEHASHYHPWARQYDEWSTVERVKPFGAWSAQWDRWQRWDVRVANEVEYALLTYSAVSQGWLSNYETDYLTVGIRDAYHHGLGIAVPTGPSELGYAMDDHSRLRAAPLAAPGSK